MNSGIINLGGRDATREEFSRLCYELGMNPKDATKLDVIKALQTFVNDAEPDENGLSPKIAGFRYDMWRSLLRF